MTHKTEINATNMHHQVDAYFLRQTVLQKQGSLPFGHTKSKSEFKSAGSRLLIITSIDTTLILTEDVISRIPLCGDHMSLILFQSRLFCRPLSYSYKLASDRFLSKFTYTFIVHLRWDRW